MRKRKMSSLPKTHEDVCKKKRLFMRLLRGRLDPVTRMDYENVVSHCDKLTARIAKILVILLALFLTSGCIENTMRETGKLIQQGGRLVTGIGTDWTRGAEGYANEK